MNKYLDNNKDYKALIFYGGAHLSREFQDKIAALGVSNLYGSEYDYFLAHFFDKIYGRNQVATFFTYPAVDNKVEKVVRIKFEEFAYDYVVEIKINPINPFPFYFLTTKKVLNIFWNLAQKNYKDNNIEYITYLNIINSFLLRSYLINSDNDSTLIAKLNNNIWTYKKDSFLFIKNFKDYDNLINGFDDIKNIDKMETYQFGEGLSDYERYINSLFAIIENIKGSREELISSDKHNQELLVNMIKEFTKNNIEAIKIYTAINYLDLNEFIDTNLLNKYLNDITKQNFSNKEEWIKWWENNKKVIN